MQISDAQQDKFLYSIQDDFNSIQHSLAKIQLDPIIKRIKFYIGWYFEFDGKHFEFIGKHFEKIVEMVKTF